MLEMRHVMMEALVLVMDEMLLVMLKQVMNEQEALAYEHLNAETESVMGQKYVTMAMQSTMMVEVTVVLWKLDGHALVEIQQIQILAQRTEVME
jgi:hypothetical protein